MGARGLAAFCLELEKLAKANQMDKTEKVLASVRQEFDM